MVLGGCAWFMGIGPDEERNMSRDVEFSIILPVCHGGRFLQAALKSIAGLDFPREKFEVLLAGSEADHELTQFVESAPAGRNIDLKLSTATASKAAQLNAAISMARGRIFVFADDDCVFFPDWLEKIGRVFKEMPEIGAVGGVDRTAQDEPPFNIAIDYVLNSFVGTGGLRRGRGLKVGKYYPKLWNMAIRRDVAHSISTGLGPHGRRQVFNEKLEVHEDVELIDRIERTGKRIVFAPEITVMHSRDTTLRSFTVRSFKMAQISRRVGVHALPHSFLSVFAVGFIALAAASTGMEPLRPALALGCVLYGAILLVSGIGGLFRSGLPSMLVYVPIVLAALHFSRGLGYLWSSRYRPAASGL
jgi:GT2 family glycosyltransferase